MTSGGRPKKKLASDTTNDRDNKEQRKKTKTKNPTTTTGVENTMSTESFRHERRLVDETDNLVLEVDEIDDENDDEWTDMEFPKDRLLSNLWRTPTRLKQCGLMVLGVAALCLAVRQVMSWSSNNKTSSSSTDNSIGYMPKNVNSSSSVSPSSSPTTTITTTNNPTSTASSIAFTQSPVAVDATPPAYHSQSPQSHAPEANTTMVQAFSVLDPVADLGILAIDRPPSSRPPRILHRLKERYGALPTNAWYQNMLMIEDDVDPASINRAYVLPYVVDAAGPIPGLRTIPGRLQVGDSTTEYIVEENFGLTLGTSTESSDVTTLNRRYLVSDATQLAVTLEWVSANHNGHHVFLREKSDSSHIC